MLNLNQLNNPNPACRLEALRRIIGEEKERPAVLLMYANNHIHTTYSFSPYSPTAAVYYARAAGLQTAGLMDHDTIAGASEFIEAGKIAGIATTIGLECRVSLAGTPLENLRVNNPDQTGNIYMALHGVPHTQVEYLQNVFKPLREERNLRNVKMVENLNSLMLPFGIELDFEKEVLPISQYSVGGTVTERHLLFALGEKIEQKAGKENTADFLAEKMSLLLTEKQRSQLSDRKNPYFLYDLLGVLKAELVSRFYIPATTECMHISELSRLARKTGSLLCYAYLGDVGESVTGDKKSQKFEDDFLDLLFEVLNEQGINAITYMPSRNTDAQLKRVQKMCREHGFIEISGEDINSPRQSFICEQLAKPQFKHLIDATWKLIEREQAETKRQLSATN